MTRYVAIMFAADGTVLAHCSTVADDPREALKVANALAPRDADHIKLVSQSAQVPGENLSLVSERRLL